MMQTLRTQVYLAPLVAASLLGGCSYLGLDHEEQAKNAVAVIRKPVSLQEMAEIGKGNELAAQCITFYSSFAAALHDKQPKIAEEYAGYVKQVAPVLILSETSLLNDKTLQETAQMNPSQQRAQAQALMLKARNRSRKRAVKWGEFFKTAKPEEIAEQGQTCDDFRPVIDQVNEQLKHDPDFAGFYKKD